MVGIGGNYLGLGNMRRVSIVRAPMYAESIPRSGVPKVFENIKEAMGEIPKPVYWFGAAALAFWFLRKRERDVGTPMFL